jgi:hypothetical protein
LVTAAHLVAAKHLGETSGFLLTVSTRIEDASEIHAAAIIDCSGNSVALKHLNLPTVSPTPAQAVALVFELENLPNLDEHTVSFTVRKLLREAVLDGDLPETISYLSIVPGSLEANKALFKLGSSAPPTGPDEASTDQSTAAMYTSLSACIPSIVACIRRRGNGFSTSVCGVSSGTCESNCKHWRCE